MYTVLYFFSFFFFLSQRWADKSIWCYGGGGEGDRLVWAVPLSL